MWTLQPLTGHKYGTWPPRPGTLGILEISIVFFFLLHVLLILFFNSWITLLSTILILCLYYCVTHTKSSTENCSLTHKNSSFSLLVCSERVAAADLHKLMFDHSTVMFSPSWVIWGLYWPAHLPSLPLASLSRCSLLVLVGSTGDDRLKKMSFICCRNCSYSFTHCIFSV